MYRLMCDQNKNPHELVWHRGRVEIGVASKATPSIDFETESEAQAFQKVFDKGEVYQMFYVKYHELWLGSDGKFSSEPAAFSIEQIRFMDLPKEIEIVKEKPNEDQ